MEEIMYEQDVVVTTKHGRMPAFVAAPDSGGPHPGVIFYMDAPGTREELRNMARRVARNGYVCLLPDMYYRLGSVRFDIPRRDDAMSGVIRASMNSITNALVTDDTAAMLGWFDANDRVSTGPVGCVGHCMSGCYITTVSARFPHRIKAAASLYGVNIVTDKPDSSHLLVPQVKGELYYAFAEHDQSVPAHVIPDLKKALAATDVANTVKVFDGTHHGFCFAERAVYDAEASEQTWADILGMFKRRLA
jgi:carboxymethylenebutenolidase